MNGSASAASRSDAELAPDGSAVAFVCHPYHRGGVTRWMADAAGEWQRRGWPVWLVAPRPRAPFMSGGGRPPLLDLVAERPAPERPTVVAPTVGSEFELGIEAYRAAVYARAVRRAVAPGVPLVLSDDAAVWAAAASLARRNPFVGVLHSDDQVYYRLAHRYGARAAALVSVSNRVAVRAREIVSGSGAVLATIPCGVPLRPPSPRPGQPQGTLRLIWAGRVEEHQKRVGDLVRIAAGLRAEGVAFSLDVVGDGPERTSVERAVRDAGLEDQVRLHGWLPSDGVWRLLAGSDVLLLPSNFEGMPIVVMEALAAGCGVVAARVSGIEDLEGSAPAADALWVYAVGDVDAAVRGTIAARAVAPARRAAAARALAEKEFSIGSCVSRYAAVLRTLVRHPGGADRGPPLRQRVVPFLSHPVAAARLARLGAGSLGRIGGGG